MLPWKQQWKPLQTPHIFRAPHQKRLHLCVHLHPRHSQIPVLKQVQVKVKERQEVKISILGALLKNKTKSEAKCSETSIGITWFQTWKGLEWWDQRKHGACSPESNSENHFRPLTYLEHPTRSACISASICILVIRRSPSWNRCRSRWKAGSQNLYPWTLIEKQNKVWSQMQWDFHRHHMVSNMERSRMVRPT